MNIVRHHVLRNEFLSRYSQKYILSHGARHLRSLRNRKIFVIYCDEYVNINYIRMFVETRIMILLSRLNRHVEPLQLYFRFFSIFFTFSFLYQRHPLDILSDIASFLISHSLLIASSFFRLFWSRQFRKRIMSTTMFPPINKWLKRTLISLESLQATIFPAFISNYLLNWYISQNAYYYARICALIKRFLPSI